MMVRENVTVDQVMENTEHSIITCSVLLAELVTLTGNKILLVRGRGSSRADISDYDTFYVTQEIYVSKSKNAVFMGVDMLTSSAACNIGVVIVTHSMPILQGNSHSNWHGALPDKISPCTPVFTSFT